MHRTATTRADPRPGRSAPRPLRLRGLLLLDSTGNGPLAIESVRFADDGIGVVRVDGQQPRVLPWTSVVGHTVERWEGGSGALISIQTLTGTYRFLQIGGDPDELSGRIAALALRHQGPTGVSTVTTMATGQPTARRRRHDRPLWPRLQPYLVVALVAVVLLAVTLILLQTAGIVHLPLLGGTGPGSLGRMVRPSGLSRR